MRGDRRIAAGMLAAWVFAATACGSDDSEPRHEICNRDGKCWRVETYASKPSDAACVTGRVFPCDSAQCPPYRYLPDQEGTCRPFGTTDRSFCTSGLEVWLDPLGGATRWDRQKQLEATELCVEQSMGWEYHACMVRPGAYRWGECRARGAAGVELEWAVADGQIPDDRTFQIVIQSMVE